MELMKFQKKMVDSLEKQSLRQWVDWKDDELKIKPIVLNSPTGSGKTLMLSKFTDRFNESIKIHRKHVSHTDEVAFIWISIGKGDLHKQSKEKFDMDKYSANNLKTYLLDEALNKGQLYRNDIVFMNWEQVNRGDKNISMRGEQKNFKKFIQKTRYPIVLIIDESHLNLRSDNSQEIIDIINPIITVEATATPDKKDGILIRPKVDLLHNSGLIKKSIEVNLFKEDTEIKEGIFKTLIDEAEHRRKELKELYEKDDELLFSERAKSKKINPLVLVQIPDGKEGNRVKDNVLEELKRIGKHENDIGIWLSGEYKNKDNIVELDSNVEYLLFKQAIVTGWDCPRAQVLLKFRATKDSAFEIQTLGRINRMPEASHYYNETLNKSYIYTDDEEFIIRAKEISMIPTDDKTIHCDLKPKFEDEVLELELYKERIEKSPMTFDFEQLKRDLDEKLQNNRTTLALEKGNYIKNRTAFIENSELIYKENKDLLIDVSKGRLSLEDLEDETFKEDENYKIKLGLEDIYFVYYDKLSQIEKNSKDLINHLYCDFLENYLNWTNETEEEMLRNKIFLIKNFKNYFRNIFYEVFKEYKEKKIREIQSKSVVGYKIPDRIGYSDKFEETNEFKKNIYEPFVKKKDISRKSNPEIDFEEMLEENENVLWWFKNLDSGQNGFSIVREYDDKLKEHYPDYLVRTKSYLLILETKGTSDSDHETPNKSECIRRYIEENKEEYSDFELNGGIVRKNDNGTWLVGLGNEYKEDLKNNDFWVDLEKILKH